MTNKERWALIGILHDLNLRIYLIECDSEGRGSDSCLSKIHALAEMFAESTSAAAAARPEEK